jgi:hypothetical protein
MSNAVTVVRLGAWCDFVTEDEYRAKLAANALLASEDDAVAGFKPFQSVLSGSAVEDALEHFRRAASFDVSEFADLSDGRRVTLHSERGFSIVAVMRSVLGGSELAIASEHQEVRDKWQFLTLNGLERDVLSTVLPDGDEPEDEHPWEWLAQLLVAKGVQVVAADLRHIPYVVEFSARLRQRLSADE